MIQLALVFPMIQLPLYFPMFQLPLVVPMIKLTLVVTLIQLLPLMNKSVLSMVSERGLVLSVLRKIPTSVGPVYGK
jgi:hypothetical protein